MALPTVWARAASTTSWRALGLLCRPVPEAGAETVGYEVQAQTPDQQYECHVGKDTPGQGSGKDQATSVIQPAGLSQDGQGPGGEGRPVGPPGLHPCPWDGPSRLLKVHLIPGHTPYLPGAAGRKRQHLEGQLRRRAGSGVPSSPESCRQLPVAGARGGEPRRGAAWQGRR